MNDENGGKEEKRKWGGLIAFARLSGRTSKKKKSTLSFFLCPMASYTFAYTTVAVSSSYILSYRRKKKKNLSLTLLCVIICGV
jgi:hypothetical protein